MKYLLLMLSVCITTACSTVAPPKATSQAGQPGFISTVISEFDGRLSLRMEPAYTATTSAPLRLGVRWHSQLPAGKLLLLAQWQGKKQFAAAAPLKLNIDGRFLNLAPSDPRQTGVVREKPSLANTADAHANVHYVTTKQYWVDETDVAALIAATKVVIRIDLANSYWEQRLEPDAAAQASFLKHREQWAKTGLQLFLNTQRQP